MGICQLGLWVLRNELGIGRADAFGGPYSGADHVARGMAIITGADWFSVLKNTDPMKVQEAGVMEQEGTLVVNEVGDGAEVIWVEDAISTGLSSEEQITTFRNDPRTRRARIIAAFSVVDRGDYARGMFRRMGIPYVCLVTYKDLGIPPVVMTEPAE